MGLEEGEQLPICVNHLVSTVNRDGASNIMI